MLIRWRFRRPRKGGLTLNNGMNPIKNIEIKRFKSIQHLKIDGCKRINVFIGYPNTGKSNIFEALSLLAIDKVSPASHLS
jgi:predicted ATP-dependent endonuclease of OLD family